VLEACLSEDRRTSTGRECDKQTDTHWHTNRRQKRQEDRQTSTVHMYVTDRHTPTCKHTTERQTVRQTDRHVRCTSIGLCCIYQTSIFSANTMYKVKQNVCRMIVSVYT